jgi:hypothetical protein
MRRVVNRKRVERAYSYVVAKGEEFIGLMEGAPRCREACQATVRLAVKLFLAGLPCSIVHGYRVEDRGGAYCVLVREGTKRRAKYVVSREEVEELQELLGGLGVYSRGALERMLEMRVDEFLRWTNLSALTYADMQALKLGAWGMRGDRGVARLSLVVRYIEAAASGMPEPPASEVYERLRLCAERYLELRDGMARLAARLFLAGLPATAAVAFSPVERGGLLAVALRGARGVYEYYLSREEAEGILSALSEAGGVSVRGLQAATNALKRGIGVEELTHIDVYNLKLRAWGVEALSSPKYTERRLRMVLRVLAGSKCLLE